MRFAALLPVTLALTACMAPPPEYDAVEQPSLEVLRAMPAGVPPSDLRLSAGCYFYETADGMVPLTTRQLSDGTMQTEQVCL